MGRSRYKYSEEDKPHFLTATINNWTPLFTRPETANIILDSWCFLAKDSGFKIYGYVILENYLHMIAQAPKLPSLIQRFKSYTAKQLLDYLKTCGTTLFLDQLRHSKKNHKQQSTYQVWQEGSHPQVIESDQVMRQKLDYIHNNPVRGGFVENPCDWTWSSAGFWMLNRQGVIEINADSIPIL